MDLHLADGQLQRIKKGLPACARVDVNRSDAVGVTARRSTAQENGRKMAMKVKVGDYVAVQAREDEQDQYWIGVAVDAGGCFEEGTSQIKEVEGRESINGTAFTKGQLSASVQPATLAQPLASARHSASTRHLTSAQPSALVQLSMSTALSSSTALNSNTALNSSTALNISIST